MHASGFMHHRCHNQIMPWHKKSSVIKPKIVYVSWSISFQFSLMELKTQCPSAQWSTLRTSWSVRAAQSREPSPSTPSSRAQPNEKPSPAPISLLIELVLYFNKVLWFWKQTYLIVQQFVVSTDQVDHCGVFQLFKIFRHGLCFTLSFSMIRNTVYKAGNVSYCLLASVCLLLMLQFLKFRMIRLH